MSSSEPQKNLEIGFCGLLGGDADVYFLQLLDTTVSFLDFANLRELLAVVMQVCRLVLLRGDEFGVSD